MASFTDTLRGDGLARAQRALAGLERDPLRLDVARRRFSHSPPPYTSDRSGTTTQSTSPEPPGEQQRRKRRVQLGREREASKPYEQFQDQRSEERERLWDADPRVSGMRPIAITGSFNKMAHENIKKNWVEQGIWNNKWNEMVFGRWKHEEPLEVESQSETDSEAPTPLFSLPQPKPRRPKSDEEKRRMAEQRDVRKREREASRPCLQFVYQISKERERIQEKSRSEEGTAAADINSRAYESVKEAWIRRGIWNRKWGILPGMSWKHEEPLQEETDNGLVSASADPVGHEVVGAPYRRIFGSLSPIEQQEQSVKVDSARLGHGDNETPSASNSHDAGIDEQVLRPITGQASKRSNRKVPQKAQIVVNEFLGPVQPSKVSKAARKMRHVSQRPNVSRKVSLGGLPSPSDMDIGEPPVHITPRRSKRLQMTIPSIATDETMAASTDPQKPTIQSKSKRKVAKTRTTRSSAKPQGISKRQPAENAGGKARKVSN